MKSLLVFYSFSQDWLKIFPTNRHQNQNSSGPRLPDPSALKRRIFFPALAKRGFVVVACMKTDSHFPGDIWEIKAYYYTIDKIHTRRNQSTRDNSGDLPQTYFDWEFKILSCQSPNKKILWHGAQNSISKAIWFHKDSIYLVQIFGNKTLNEMMYVGEY